jgi:hypothetical protein
MNAMSDSSSRFLVGFTKALERSKRTKQQTVQKVTADAVAIDVVTSNAIITTPQDHDELYRTTIIQNMITLIKQRKMK